jgi:hypothetical protein
MLSGGVSPIGNPRHETGYDPSVRQQKRKLLDRPREALATPTRGPAHQERCFCTEDEAEELSRYEGSGRPLGREPFVVHVEEKRGRTLLRRKPGLERGRTA